MPPGSPDDSQESFVWEEWDEMMVNKNNPGSSQAASSSAREGGNRGGCKEMLLQGRAG